MLSSSAIAQLDYCDVVVSLLSCLHALYTLFLTTHYSACVDNEALKAALLKFDKSLQKLLIDKLCVDVQNCALTLLNVETKSLLNHLFIEPLQHERVGIGKHGAKSSTASLRLASNSRPQISYYKLSSNRSVIRKDQSGFGSDDDFDNNDYAPQQPQNAKTVDDDALTLSDGGASGSGPGAQSDSPRQLLMSRTGQS